MYPVMENGKAMLKAGATIHLVPGRCISTKVEKENSNALTA